MEFGQLPASNELKMFSINRNRTGWVQNEALCQKFQNIPLTLHDGSLDRQKQGRKKLKSFNSSYHKNQQSNAFVIDGGFLAQTLTSILGNKKILISNISANVLIKYL